MTDNNISTPRSGHSSHLIERTLRIDGERSSAFFSTAIRVARLDSRLRELAGVQNPDARKIYRQACDAYSKAIGMFEDELTSIERTLAATRRGPRNAGGNGANRPRRDKAPAQNTAHSNNSGATAATSKGKQPQQKQEQPLEAKDQKQTPEAKGQKQPREAKQQNQQREAKPQKPAAQGEQSGPAVTPTAVPAQANHVDANVAGTPATEPTSTPVTAPSGVEPAVL